MTSKLLNSFVTIEKIEVRFEKHIKDVFPKSGRRAEYFLSISVNDEIIAKLDALHLADGSQNDKEFAAHMYLVDNNYLPYCDPLHLDNYCRKKKIKFKSISRTYWTYWNG